MHLGISAHCFNSIRNVVVMPICSSPSPFWDMRYCTGCCMVSQGMELFPFQRHGRKLTKPVGFLFMQVEQLYGPWFACCDSLRACTGAPVHLSTRMVLLNLATVIDLLTMCIVLAYQSSKALVWKESVVSDGTNICLCWEKPSCVTRKWILTLCTVWGVTVAAFIMGLPLLQGPTAFLATTSIATVGLALCYGVPIGLHALALDRFEAGPFTLGRYVTNQVEMSLHLQVIYSF